MKYLKLSLNKLNWRVKSILYFVLFISFFFSLGKSEAQKAAQNYFFTLDSEELITLKPDRNTEQEISIAGFNTTTTKNTPAIVTVISGDEIAQMGARDLIDILRFVPGFSFAQDINHGSGLSVRGNWAFEGRFLFMLNGMQMNEVIFGTYLFGQHSPLNNIDRIEIIRGTAAAKYGGLATLAIINIVTNKGIKHQGLNFSTMTGLSNDQLSRNSLEASVVQHFNSGLHYSVTGKIGSGLKSTQVLYDEHGNTTDYSDNTALYNGQLLFNLGIKKFNFQLYFDQYEFEDVHTQQMAVSQTFGLDAGYRTKLSKKVELFTQFTFKSDLPRLTEMDESANAHSFSTDTHSSEGETFAGDLSFNAIFNSKNTRFNGIVGTTISPTSAINVTLGGQFYIDKVSHRVHIFSLGNKGHSRLYTNMAGFTDFSLNTRIVNLTAGFRFDKFQGLKPVLVQRFALTKEVGKFHSKAIFNTSFKLPTRQTFEMLRVHESIVKHEEESLTAEKVRSLEFELGYQFNEKMSLSTNIFDMYVDNTIISSLDSQEENQNEVGHQGEESHESEENFQFNSRYSNSGTLRTRGIEITGRYKPFNQVNLSASYSYYHAVENTVPEVSLDGYKGLIAGTAPHKMTLLAIFSFGKRIKLTSSLMYQSKKYGFESYTKENYDTDEKTLELHQLQFNPVNYLNLNITYKNLLTRGIDISFGGYNLLNQELYFVSPNRFGQRPLPDQGREFILRLTYNLDVN